MKFLSNVVKSIMGFFTNNEKGSVLWLLEQLVLGVVKGFRLAGQFLAEFVARQEEKKK